LLLLLWCLCFDSVLAHTYYNTNFPLSR